MEVDGLVFGVRADPRPTPSAPTVVLVHGIGMSHRYLRRLRAVLAEQAAVVCVDLPGHGGMPRPDRDVDVETMGAALAEALRRSHLGRVVLVGHSMGSQWVVEAGRRDPAAVARVVIIGPVTDERHRTAGRQTLALLVDTTRESPRVNAVVTTDYLRTGPRWYLAQLRHMLTYPIEDRIRGLRMPVVVIRGARDPIAGLDWCRRLADAAPHGELIEIAGPHVVQERSPRATASAILPRRIPAPDAALRGGCDDGRLRGW